MFGISIRMQTVAYQALICIAIIGFCGNVEGKALNGMAVTHLVNTRVADRFKDWKDGDEYVNHDYYTRKRNRNLEREREHELEGERKRMHERDLQRERDHKNLLEKLRTTPMAAIAPTGPLSNPLPQMPRPQLPPFPTQAPLPSAQIQAPPIQTSDRNLDVLSTLPVAQYDSVSMATGSGANWFSSAGGDDAAREIYSSTNLGGGIYDNFGGKGSSLSSGADWRELAHWYREQNWGLDSDWSSRGGHLGGHGYGHSYGKNDHNKHGGCSNKNHKINDIKNGLLKAGATALYVKKIGIAFLVALLAPSIVITVLGPFLIALSLAPLNFQLYGFSPAALSTQQQARQQKFIVPGQQLRSQQIQQSQPLDKYLAIKTPSDGSKAVKVRKRRNISNLPKFTLRSTGHSWPDK